VTKTGTESANSRFMNENYIIFVLMVMVPLKNFGIRIPIGYKNNDETLSGVIFVTQCTLCINNSDRCLWQNL